MIGPRIGPSVGGRQGPAVGPGADQSKNDSTGTPQTTLTVAIADSADPVITAVNYDYTTVVTNTGANSATNVVCTITLDPQLTHVSTSGTGWSVDTTGLPVIVCTRATLAVGAAPTITTTVTSPSAGETSSTTADADADNAPAATQDTETTVCNLVTKDATSGKRVPANGTEFASLMSYFGVSVTVASIYLMQEASGNLADSVGSVTLTANGSPLYQQAVTGWTRKGVGFNGGGGQRFMAASGAGPNPATTSSLWCFFMSATAAPAATRTIVAASDSGSPFDLRVTSSPVTAVRCVGTTTNGTDSPTNDAIQPNVLHYSRAGSLANGYTGVEKIVGTYNSGVTDGNKGIGSIGAASSVTGQAVYGFRLDGANAEISAATVKSLLQAFGFTIAWS